MAQVMKTLIGGIVCVGSVWGGVWGINQVLKTDLTIGFLIGIGIVILALVGVVAGARTMIENAG